jgi:hypothetical protein
VAVAAVADAVVTAAAVAATVAAAVVDTAAEAVGRPLAYIARQIETMPSAKVYGIVS